MIPDKFVEGMIFKCGNDLVTILPNPNNRVRFKFESSIGTREYLYTEAALKNFLIKYKYSLVEKPLDTAFKKLDGLYTKPVVCPHKNLVSDSYFNNRTIYRWCRDCGAAI